MRTLTAFAIFPADTTTPTFCEVIFGVRKEPSRFVGLAANGIVVVWYRRRNRLRRSGSVALSGAIRETRARSAS
jgi:hypothetical protein